MNREDNPERKRLAQLLGKLLALAWLRESQDKPQEAKQLAKVMYRPEVAPQRD